MSKGRKKTSSIVDMVWQLAEPLAQSLDCELVDVEYIKEGGCFFLRIYIDREPSVDLEFCQKFSEAFSEILDHADPINSSYYLEVSSPGIERPLKKTADFQRFSGQTVSISLYASLNGKKEYTGKLEGLIDNELIISVNEEEKIKIPYDLVAKARLKVFF